MANQNVLDLRDVAAKGAELEGQSVTVEGWVRNHRKQKSIGFIEFFDGTVLAPMQIVYDDQVKDFAAVQAIRCLLYTSTSAYTAQTSLPSLI